MKRFVIEQLSRSSRLSLSQIRSGRIGDAVRRDLSQHHLIGGPIDGGDQNWRARRQAVTELQPIDLRVRTRAASGAVACASAGLGIAVASTWMCAEELASGALVEVLADYRIDPITAFVVFPLGGALHRRRRAFSDYLEQALSTLSHDQPSA